MNAPALLPRPPRRRDPRPAPDGVPADRRRYSQEEYLARERGPGRAHEARTELHAGGKLFEMSGASLAHQALVQDLTFEIRLFLDEEAFVPMSEGMKFRPPACRFYYPDVMITPNPPELLDEAGDVVRDPLFVAEVLSPSTEATDRGEKLDCYRGTPSVREYWLIAQDAVRVERHHRPPGGAWDVAVYEDRGERVPLPPLGGAVGVGRLYRRALPA